MLSEILKSVNENPKTVILILIGFIFIGSVSGGLWINNLHDSLEQTRKIADDRLKVIEDINRNKLLESKLNLKLAATDVAETELQIKDSIDVLIQNLEKTISKNDKLSEVDKKLLISEIKQKLSNFKVSFSGQIDKAMIPLVTAFSGNSISLYIRYTLLSLLVVSILVVLWLYSKKE